MSFSTSHRQRRAVTLPGGVIEGHLCALSLCCLRCAVIDQCDECVWTFSLVALTSQLISRVNSWAIHGFVVVFLPRVFFELFLLDHFFCRVHSVGFNMDNQSPFFLLHCRV
jgi:hypothetical protein